MKKRRTPRTPMEGLGFDVTLPADSVGGASSVDGVLAMLQATSAEVTDVGFDEVTRTLELDAQFEISQASRPVDSSFDPWRAEYRQVETYGLASPEMAAWASAQAIVANRAAIEVDGRLLLEAIARVLDFGLQSPDWLAQAYRKRLGVFQTYETATLDRAFGLKPPNERTRLKHHGGRELRGKIHAALLDRLRASPDRPIDNELWEEVAQQFEIGKTKCQELYNAAVTKDGAGDLVAFKRVLKFANGIPPK